MKNFDQQAKMNISARKTAAEYSALRNLETLRKDETYFSLESEKMRLSLEIAKMASKGLETGDLKSSLSKVKLELSNRGKLLGFKESDIVPSYTCKACNDSGYLDGEACTCLKQEKYKLIKLDGNIGLTDIFSFADISLEKIHKENIKSLTVAYNLLDKFVAVFPEAPKSHIITLLGTVGCGKTYAASVAGNAVMDKGYTSLLIPSFKLADLFSKYHYAFEINKPYILSSIYDVDLLIIDDLGTEEIQGDFLPAYLYQLLFNREDKFTIITTNHRMDAIQDKYGKRIYSRIADTSRAKVIELQGKDLRI